MCPLGLFHNGLVIVEVLLTYLLLWQYSDHVIILHLTRKLNCLQNCNLVEPLKYERNWRYFQSWVKRNPLYNGFWWLERFMWQTLHFRELTLLVPKHILVYIIDLPTKFSYLTFLFLADSKPIFSFYFLGMCKCAYKWHGKWFEIR